MTPSWIKDCGKKGSAGDWRSEGCEGDAENIEVKIQKGGGTKRKRETAIA